MSEQTATEEHVVPDRIEVAPATAPLGADERNPVVFDVDDLSVYYGTFRAVRDVARVREEPERPHATRRSSSPSTAICSTPR